MNKIMCILSIAAAVTLMSCSDEPKKVTKEVIVVPSTPVIVVKELPKKPTTIILDKNGVKVEGKKVDVTIKKQ